MTSSPRQQHQQPVVIDDDHDDDDDDDDGSPPDYVDHVTTGNAGSLLTPSLIGCMTAPPPYQSYSTATQPSGLATHKHFLSSSTTIVPPSGARAPLPLLFPPCPFTSSSFALFYFFPFSFSHSLYLVSFVHPFPFFYHNRPAPR